MDSSLFFVIFSLFLTFSCTKTCLADFGNLHDTCPTATTEPEEQTVFINGFPCKNPSTISAPDFKTSKLSQRGDTENFARSSLNILTAAVFPGLNTLGLSIARTDLEIDGLAVPHSHPRASEMIFVNKGVVFAGFLDTQNQVFQNILKEGDVFVFPTGLLHFYFNMGFEPAVIFSVLNSQNPGLVSLGGNMFDPEDNEEMVRKLVKRLITVSKQDLSENHYNYRNLSLLKFPSLVRI
ncbi:hypothetical protein UlMin_006373 [Ulmus minor]